MYHLIVLCVIVAIIQLSDMQKLLKKTLTVLHCFAN